MLSSCLIYSTRRAMQRVIVNCQGHNLSWKSGWTHIYANECK